MVYCLFAAKLSPEPDFLWIGPWRTWCSETLSNLETIQFKKLYMKMLCAQWGAFCSSFTMLSNNLTQWANMPHIIAIMDLRKSISWIHYSDVIQGAIASEITSLTIVYSTVYSGAHQRKYQSSATLALCVGNSPVTGEFPAQRASNAENVII